MFIVFACMSVQGVFAQAQKEEINKQAFELRWQLHRYKWFTLMGKVYRLTKK
ncbi:heparinase II/III family protein [uncultured Prevotella sp.]|uniref:heparinase II/III family protein n=1 Tax=uncultured Prevotella sp. TaxID=159272 RepID=UPI0025FFA291|nr:heparinase II/III family protein [uncultured Prevotella sp.]MEE1385918.1 heparinase II/III family protein [Prevotella sp.]